MPDKLEARVSKHDREIAAIRKLLLTGMKMLARSQEHSKAVDRQLDLIAGEHAALAKDMRELAAAQRRTEATLERFIRSLGRGGGNGHGNIDFR